MYDAIYEILGALNDRRDTLPARRRVLVISDGKDEGGPGPRGDSGFYAGYFRDLDGNKAMVKITTPTPSLNRDSPRSASHFSPA